MNLNGKLHQCTPAIILQWNWLEENKTTTISISDLSVIVKWEMAKPFFSHFAGTQMRWIPSCIYFLHIQTDLAKKKEIVNKHQIQICKISNHYWVQLHEYSNWILNILYKLSNSIYNRNVLLNMGNKQALSLLVWYMNKNVLFIKIWCR